MKLDTNRMSLEAIVYSRCHYYHGVYAKPLSGDFVGTECSTETVCAERYPNSMQLLSRHFCRLHINDMASFQYYDAQ